MCYTQFANKQVSSPTYIPATSWCSAYRNSACCNADTVAQCVPAHRHKGWGLTGPGVCGKATLNPLCLYPPPPPRIDAGTYNGALYPGYSAPCVTPRAPAARLQLS